MDMKERIGVRPVVTAAIAVTVVTMVGAQSDVPRAAPASVGLSRAKLEEATTLLQQFVADRKVAGAVAAVARQGKVAYFETIGVQDLESRTPMSARSLFRIYSMTRPITAVGAMMLHEEGKFRLEDPIGKFLPEFRAVMVMSPQGPRRPAREITVEDLLLHTSGINDRQSELYRREHVRQRSQALPQLIANIVRVGLMEDPGTRHRYGEGTSVVGRLIEVWSGKPLDVFFEERIFRPLRMRDSGFVVRADQKPQWTTVYAPGAGGLTANEVEDVPFTEKPALLEGTVGVVTTVPDYLRFCQMLMNRGELDGVRLLTRESVERLTRNGLPEAVLKQRGRGDVGWGLINANVVLDQSSPLRGEYSWDGTAGTIFWIDPAREMITLLFAPARPSNPDGIRQKFKAVVQQAIVP
jgi:CubicO group peptidase (beta-lactamase class C family)